MDINMPATINKKDQIKKMEFLLPVLSKIFLVVSKIEKIWKIR
jgi:hypothetical protein